MARKSLRAEDIIVTASVMVGDKEVSVDDLTPEQKSKLGAWIQCQCLNAQFAGKARFWPGEKK